MDFVRRWRDNNPSTDRELEHPEVFTEDEEVHHELDIVQNEVKRVRKRELLGSSTNSDMVATHQSKRRKLSGSARFSFSNLFFNPVKTMYRLISGGDSDSDNEEFQSKTLTISKRNGQKKFSFPSSPRIIDLTMEAENESQDGGVIGIMDVRAELQSQNDLETLCLDDCNRTLKECGDGSVVVDDDNSNEVQVVAEFCHSSRNDLKTSRKSVEYIRDQVAAASSCSPLRNSPLRSDSICSFTTIEADNDHNHDRVSASPSPEDSISRQVTPRGFYHESVSREDRWRRRKSLSSQSSINKSSVSAVHKVADRIRKKSFSNSVRSPVNLSARDRYMELLAEYGNGSIDFTSIREMNTGQRKRPVRKLKRLNTNDDSVRRVRDLLKRIDGRGLITKRSFEKQPSVELSSSEGSTTLTPSPNDSDGVEGLTIVECNDRSSSPSVVQTLSRSHTPMSLVSTSSSSDRLNELMTRLKNVELRGPTAQRHYSRYQAEQRGKREREIELVEETRIRSIARITNREELEAQTRKRLALQGIRVPKLKPILKDEFPPLPDDALDLCDIVWQKQMNPNENFSEGFGIKLTRKDLLTLCDLDWLNDEIINFYLQLVCERSAHTEEMPKVYAFNTFFYSNINSKGYASVKRWTRKIDIFSYDILLVPVHLNVHWCMAVIDLGEKKIDYYDSLLGRNQRCLDDLKNYLMEESKDKKKQPFDFTNWKYNLRSDIPRQLNGSDCGVFSCKFAEFASRRKEVTFNQEHMPYYRQRMVYELVNKKLL